VCASGSPDARATTSAVYVPIGSLRLMKAAWRVMAGVVVRLAAQYCVRAPDNADRGAVQRGFHAFVTPGR
jgi:hypothetical protein